MATNIDRTSNSESVLAVLPSANLFIGKPQCRGEKKRKLKPFQDPPQPTAR
jgi:hypothetical protein